MNVIAYLFLISIIFFVFYAIEVVYLLFSIIRDHLFFENFVKYLLLIGSFSSFFFSLNINFFNKHKLRSFDNVKLKVNVPYAVVNVILILLMHVGFLFGVWMDINNIGFSSVVEADFYFFIIQTSIGFYTGHLISDIFEILNNINFDE